MNELFGSEINELQKHAKVSIITTIFNLNKFV